MANKTTRRAGQGRDTSEAPAKSILSVQRAFVVQFREISNAFRRVWQGRVEHIASGRAVTFANRNELLAFLRLALPMRTQREEKGGAEDHGLTMDDAQSGQGQPGHSTQLLTDKQRRKP